ncbi:Hypothetical predicted protein [Paramuricea clavata]|uniref:Uncharacterized protein n=1 Tax=Paramuricea clavata TaxID=317549 RepID=A0A6S7K3M8_PARCT|nr:Hypothetical predicted protein [Paramuricea clavata]
MTTLVSGETILSENTTAEAAQDHQEVEQETFSGNRDQITAMQGRWQKQRVAFRYNGLFDTNENYCPRETSRVMERNRIHKITRVGIYQLCKTDEIDYKMIGSLYRKVFGNHDATDVMNLEGASLDIHTESDAEIEQRNDDDIDSISNLKS